MSNRGTLAAAPLHARTASISCSYAGVPSDLNFLIRFPPSPELLDECDSGSTWSSDPWRLRAPLEPKRIATRKANIPAVTLYMNIASAIKWLAGCRR